MFIGKTKTRQSAFTLIEVLIAMVIFGFVITLSVSSYRLSLLKLNKEDKQERVQQLTHVKLINKQVRTLKPFFITLTDFSRAPFFYGNANGFAFITDNPIQSTAALAVAKVYLVDETLKYCDVPFGSIELERFSLNDISCDKPITYMFGKNIKIDYFGWKSQLELDDYYSPYFNVNVKPKPSWKGAFVSTERKLLPIYIRIDMQSRSSIILKLPLVSSLQSGAANAFEG